MFALRGMIAIVIAIVAIVTAAADEIAPRFAIVVDDSCLISEHDIASYEFATHRIVLTEAAHHQRLNYSMKEFDASVPFELKVDGEVIYSGTIVTPLSSHIPAGPIIATPIGASGEFTISVVRGDEVDPRYNRRVLEVMREVGVLIE